MDVFRYLSLVILFSGIKAESFFISKDATSWKTASKQCQLAIPDLKFSFDKTTVDLPMDIAIDDDEEVWVGYYQARSVFEYFGCALKTNSEPSFTTKADPGQCMSACGTTNTIGTFGNECFCFDHEHLQENTHITVALCSQRCENPSTIVCGGVNDSGVYISLYRFIGIDSSDEYTNDFDCMNYDNRGFLWGDCKLSYEVICGNEKGAWIVHQNDYFDWATGTTKCYANESRPSTFMNTAYITRPENTPSLWTGIVRSEMIFKYTNNASLLERANKFGYLKKKKDGTIEFKLADKNNRKSICVNGAITTSSSTDVSTKINKFTYTPTNTKTTFSRVTTLPLSTEHVAPTRAPNNDTGSTDQFKGEDGPSDVGAIVGATLSIVVVFVIIIGGVLYLRKRRNKLPFLKKDKQATSPNHVKNNNDYVISRPVEILQSTYQSDQYEYAEINLNTSVDNDAKNDTSNGARESSGYAHDYVVLETVKEETYDSTKPQDQKSDPNTFNPYNKLTFGESSTYDRIGDGAVNAGRKVSDSENTYNTTSLGNSYLKTKVGQPNNANNITEDPEDTYNHTNIPRQQLGLRASENDYDAI